MAAEFRSAAARQVFPALPHSISSANTWQNISRRGLKIGTPARRVVYQVSASMSFKTLNIRSKRSPALENCRTITPSISPFSSAVR